MPRNQVELLGRQMEEAYRPLRRRLEGLGEEELWWEPVPGAWTLRRQPDGRLMEDYEDLDPVPALKTNWGEEWPTWRVFWTMIQHDSHHGGEIGCLRDLYFHRV
jgi:hypothetical protein